MIRRTKIVATLGPATDADEVLGELLRAGMNVARINFSHGTPDDHYRRVKQLRRIAEGLNMSVGVLGDLQGPKIRIEHFADGAVTLQEGDRFVLDTALAADAGNSERVGVTYKQLTDDVQRGDTLLLDDGAIALWVEEVDGQQISTRVVVGGELSNGKGINRKGGGLSAAVLTEKDRKDIQLAVKLGVDYLAVSFARDAGDMELARELMQSAGGDAHMVAKIERREALENIEQILAASDVIMIARGDLGVEIGDADLPGVQKRLIKQAREHNRVVITATQMMQSMISSPQPTRAEVLDVANAVLDGTDAVMLSAETAVGKFPAKVISAMGRICLGAERHDDLTYRYAMELELGNAEEAIAMAAMYAANRFQVSAIVALTESGRTALLMSRANAPIPIYAITPHPASARRIALYRGVAPIPFDIVGLGRDGRDLRLLEGLRQRGLVSDGEQIIITRGESSGVSGRTNTLKIIQVGEAQHR